MNTENTLKDLGLEEKEVKTYLALLELGEAAVLSIAQKSGIKRPTAYVILHELEEKGFVSRVIKGKKTLFTPQHPQKLVTEAELRLKELKASMPQLESLFHKDEGKPRVMIYEGKENLDRAFDEGFLTKGDVIYMGTLVLSKESFPRTFKKVSYATLSPDFTMRELLDDSKESREYAEQVNGPYHKIRFMPKEFLPFEADISIYGNRTLITSVKKEFFTISIESEEISRSFRTIFNVMWEAGRE